AFRDLTLEARQELAPCRSLLTEVECIGYIRLCFAKESRKLDEVDAILTIVVSGVAAEPAGAVGGRSHADGISRRTSWIAGRTGQCRADQSLKASFGSVGGHFTSLPHHRCLRVSRPSKGTPCGVLSAE